MAVKVDLEDRERLVQIASTSLQSKVVSHNASLLAPIACDAVREVRTDRGGGELRCQEKSALSVLRFLLLPSRLLKNCRRAAAAQCERDLRVDALVDAGDETESRT